MGKRIKKPIELVNAIMKPKKPNRLSVSDQNNALSLELARHEHKGIEFVIGQLFAYRKIHGPIPVNYDGAHSNAFHLISQVIRRYARSSHALSIAEMMLWPEVVNSVDGRQILYCFLLALEKVGDSSLLPHLYKVREKLMRDEAMLNIVNETIKACGVFKS